LKGGAARWALLCVALSACRQVLGIQEAELAPEAGAGQAGEGTSDASRGATLCERYCDSVMTNCVGAHAVYTSRENCLDVCAALPPGIPDDTGVDSVECRLGAARLAARDPARCSGAGPYGGGDCGEACISLCGLRERVCAAYEHSDVGACLAECAKLPDLGSYSIDPAARQQSGPHVQCRIFHVAQAATGDAAHECVSADGAAPCQN